MELEIPEVPFEDVKAAIDSKYRALWATIFGGHPGLTPATLEVLSEDTNAGYRAEHNTLVLGISPHDLTDREIVKPEREPWWLSDLVHEMAHEYQTKVVAGAPTEEGRTLHAQYQDLYPQAGHDETYFTGVPLFARVCGKPIKEFVEWIAPCPFL